VILSQKKYNQSNRFFQMMAENIPSAGAVVRIPWYCRIA
jgi:hypothetical protein